MSSDTDDLCPCCQKRLGRRQFTRHRRRYLQQLEHDLALEQENDGGGPAPGDDNGLALGDNNGLAPGDDNNFAPGLQAQQEVEPAPGGEEADPVALLVDLMAELEAAGQPLRSPDAMSTSDDDPPMLVLPPEHERAHQVRRNPPVTIEEWPDPNSDHPSEASDDDDQSAVGEDRDPEYVERAEAPGLDPDDEPLMDDEQLAAFLEMHLGDLAEEEWIDLYDRYLSEKDQTTLQFLATRLHTHFSRDTYNELRHGVCAPLAIPSEVVAWRRLRILSGVQNQAYDCCINSCLCYLGKYKDLISCPFCKESRYNAAGKARRTYHYTPLIPQLHSLFQNPDMITKMRWRAESEARHEPGKFEDVYDGEHYRQLRETELHEGSGYHFFDNLEDIALGLSTDGFSLFKRRRRGLSTAWPIILINYNLHPRIRTRLENVICVGVIPGPKQCKDLNSFLVPLLDELLKLENGVEASKVAEANDMDEDGSYFVLRAFIIILFGDIPAIAKLLMMKGHNAILPCRTCYTRGVLCKLKKNSVYYVPFTHPGDEDDVFDFEFMLPRDHESCLHHMNKLDTAHNKTERDNIARESGINGRPIFARLKSINLACCAPYDIMHLLFENLVPNMIKHWTGNFKGLGQGTGNYQISVDDWATIGRLTKETGRTIPSAFVGTLPNIADDGNLFKAEAYEFWFQYVAPIVLQGRLPEPYYQHFMLMREIFIWCLQLEISSDEIDELQDMIHEWITDYEREAYTTSCLISLTGPLWASWAYVMERFCGHLLVPGLKNRVRPYEYLDNYIQRRAQMQIVSRIHNLPLLTRPKVNYRYQAGEKLSSRETMYPEFDNLVLGAPVNKNVRLTKPMENQLIKYFATANFVLRLRTRQAILDRIDTDTMVRYGRFRLAGDGDKVRVADLIERDPSIARDNSFVRYTLVGDANANFRNLPDDPIEVTHYGQVLDVYYVEFIMDPENNVRKPYLLARIRECNTRGVDAALPQSPVVKYTRLSTPDIIHLDTVNAVVGRVQVDHRTWAIIDRSRDGARTRFVDDDDDDDLD